MFNSLKRKPNIEQILRKIAVDLAEHISDLLASHAEIICDLEGIEADERELGVFYVSIVAIIGNKFAQGSSTEKSSAIESFINNYFEEAAKLLKIPRRELSEIYIKRAGIYSDLLDKCFAGNEQTAPDQLATTLYSYVFYPDDKPGNAIGNAMVGFIYKLAVDGKNKLQGV